MQNHVTNIYSSLNCCSLYASNIFPTIFWLSAMTLSLTNNAKNKYNILLPVNLIIFLKLNQIKLLFCICHIVKDFCMRDIVRDMIWNRYLLLAILYKNMLIDANYCQKKCLHVLGKGSFNNVGWKILGKVLMILFVILFEFLFFYYFDRYKRIK